MFLTPDLQPFFGGTYFPPEDRYGMPGFPKLLEALHDAWDQQAREDIEEQAKQFDEGLAASGRLRPGRRARAPGSRSDLDQAAAQKLRAWIDRDHGGFGGAPKFPNPMNVALLLRALRGAAARRRCWTR